MRPVRSQERAHTVGDLTLQIGRFFGLVVIGFSVAGCYTLEPAAGVAPELGTNVAFDVNDVGRVALGGAMGPEIAQIEGRLISKEGDGADYLVAVSAVRLLRGGEQVWRGEQIHIKSEYVTKIYLRRYSRGRTIALSAAGIGAVAILASASILGSGGLDPDPPLPDTGVGRRVPRPRSLPPRSMHFPFPPLRTP